MLDKIEFEHKILAKIKFFRLKMTYLWVSYILFTSLKSFKKGSGSGSPLARGTVSEIRIRTKMSRIPNIGKKLQLLKFLRENIGNYFRKLYKSCCSFIVMDVPLNRVCGTGYAISFLGLYLEPCLDPELMEGGSGSGIN
jgi:hypothetical protein